MLSHKELLPNGYFKTPSEKIKFEKYNLRVPVAIEEFVAMDPEQGLIASISSFGFGGSSIVSFLLNLRLHVRRHQDPADTLFYVSMKSALSVLLLVSVPRRARFFLPWVCQLSMFL